VGKLLRKEEEKKKSTDHLSEGEGNLEANTSGKNKVYKKYCSAQNRVKKN